MHFLDYAGPTANENDRSHGFPPKNNCGTLRSPTQGNGLGRMKVLKLKSTPRRQLVKQRLGFFQIERVEAFGEPAVDWSEKIAGLVPLPLIAPEPRGYSG